MPELIIIAGANGAGKTTFARPYVKELGFDFLNADDIAKMLADQGEKSPMVKAGRFFFEKLDTSLKNSQDLVVETTLSGTYISKVAKRAKIAGYSLKVIYIFLDSPEMCILRVKTRLKKGGHDVPAEDVERRFYRSIHNFWDNFRALCDEWNLIYNGDEGLQLAAHGDNSEFVIENRILLNLFEAILEYDERG